MRQAARFEHGPVIDPAADAATIFAANLRGYRRRAGLTQEALAQAARLHPNAIGLLERGKRDPQLATLLAIARALSVASAKRITVADLIAGIE